MLQSMLVTGITPLQSKDEINNWENRPFSGDWTEKNHRKIDITRNRTIKKKCKRVRTAYTTDQLRALEKTFQLTRYINSENRQELSKKLNIGEKCIKIWFQNRRMKEKRESSESSDTSSEILGNELMSPSLVIQPETENTGVRYNQQHNQYATPVYHEPYAYYQSSVFQAYNVDDVQGPPDNAFIPINDYNNGMFFFNETNQSQYSPSGEVDVNNAYVYQNQNQYSSDVFNWCANNMDSYNFYQ